jgi:eukaryotic-like serine/threonine-protein kinase
VVSPGGQRAGGRVLARRYHLQRVLGRGAMGAVWEAEDTFLRRTVAVKEVVLPGSLSPEERAVSCERTLREARAIARLGHPNVVTLFDVLDEDARPWVVMELVPSRSLAEVIKEDGPLHPLRVATVGLAILGALEAAHAAGITHRDVKPGNILLGHDGRVKLTDFGIARAAGDDTITGTGLLVGSPSYIAPEIVKGLEAGAPADMWGLGATLYAAVEGRAPFSGGDAMETLSKVVQEPPSPYERAGPLVPALDAMLEKDPVTRARPVDARRALLDVLRGGAETEAPARSGTSARSGARSEAPARSAPPVAAPEPPPSAPETPPEPAVAAAGPGLADLLVPVWRQGRSEESPLGSAPARDAGERATPEPAGKDPATGGHAVAASSAAGDVEAGRRKAGESGTTTPGGGSDSATPDGSDTAAPGSGSANGDAASGGTASAGSASGSARAGSVSGSSALGGAASRGSSSGSASGSASGAARGAAVGSSASGSASGSVSGAPRGAAGGSSASGGAASGGAAVPVGGLAAAAAAGATALRRDGSDEASGPHKTAPASVAGSTVGERARDLLADDADLVDPDVADPGLVDMNAATHTDLGAPLEPLAMPDRPADEAPADSDATVTIPSRPLSGTASPPTSRRSPAYGSYGGGDELGTQRIAPLPFGAQPTPAQQPARAFRPQPPSSPLDFQDERSRGDRRKRGVAALLVLVLLVVAVLAGGFLLVRSLRGGGEPNAAGPPSASSSLGAATIPAGFTKYAGAGYSVAIPKDWPPKERPNGVVDAREPGDSTRFLRLITVQSTASAFDQLSAAEQQFKNDPSYGAYQRVKLEKIDYRGLDAADWEFTFTLDGVARHVLYRGIVTDGKTFGLYLSTPADQWTKSTGVFQVAADTFRTG